MGKGRVISHQGDGLYRIELVEDRLRAETRKTTAQQRIIDIDGKLTELEQDRIAAQSEVDAAASAQDQAIQDYQAAVQDPEVDEAPLRQAMVEAGEAVIEAAAKRDAIAANIRALKAEKLAMQKSIERIDALPALRQIDAWCADLTEDLSGEVATAEVNAEADQVLVRPGFEGRSVYDPARDGALQPALSGTPASVYYNLAMLPGTQKWRPTYRIGTITAIDYKIGTCSVTLDAAKSSQQSLDINAQTSFADVPVQYMECNATVFQINDRVLVLFAHDPETPMVVGFESHPLPCCTCEGQILDAQRYLSDVNYTDMFGGTVYTEFCPDSLWRVIELVDPDFNNWGETTRGGFDREVVDGEYQGVTMHFDEPLIIETSGVVNTRYVYFGPSRKVESHTISYDYGSTWYDGLTVYITIDLWEQGTGNRSFVDVTSSISGGTFSYPYTAPSGYWIESFTHSRQAFKDMRFEVGCFDRDAGEVVWPTPYV